MLKFLIQPGRDQISFRVFDRFHHDVETDIFERTGSGEDADVPFKKAIKRDLFAPFRDDKHSHLSMTQQKKPVAITGTAVDHRSRRQLTQRDSLFQPLLLLWSQFLPKGQRPFYEFPIYFSHVSIIAHLQKNRNVR
jgi:hypothetical protein